MIPELGLQTVNMVEYRKMYARLQDFSALTSKTKSQEELENVKNNFLEFCAWMRTNNPSFFHILRLEVNIVLQRLIFKTRGISVVLD